jgi:hypothetical protein
MAQTQARQQELEPTQTTGNHRVQPSQALVVDLRTSRLAIPYALPVQLWETSSWAHRRSSDFISLEEGIDAAIWDEAGDLSSYHRMSRYHRHLSLTLILLQQDVVYFWARPHPAGASASGDSLGKPTGWDWTQASGRLFSWSRSRPDTA